MMHNLPFGSENLQFCDGVSITIFRLRLFLLLCLNHLMIFHFCSKVKNCFYGKRCTIFFRAYFFSIESMMQNKPSGRNALVAWWWNANHHLFVLLRHQMKFRRQSLYMVELIYLNHHIQKPNLVFWFTFQRRFLC